MNRRNWQIVYSDYTGPEKKAIELVNKEVGAQILRDGDRYTFYTLDCIKAEKAVLDKNSIVVGVFDKNSVIQKYINKEEIPADGYVVKVMDNPENTELKLVLITALKPREVFYGAVDFVDDYFSGCAFKRAELYFYNELFDHPLPDYYNASSPVIKTRNIFTWGHPISDYENYIDNMARLRFNQLIVWNDFVPINAKDIADYAHEYGIELIWGFAWGWSRKCDEIDLTNLNALTDEVVKKYEDEYANCGADGIYFQSFTELKQEYIGDKLIAEAVTDFVNKTSDELLKRYPDLKIQFGLHALSVKEKLEYIRNVDKRIDIVWEDCGTFPYTYQPFITSEEDYEKAKQFTTDVLSLREGCVDGVLYKGHLILDWEGDHFAHQTGSYIMGKAAKRTVENDKKIEKPLWKDFQKGWIMNGKYAYDMTCHIRDLGNEKLTVGVAGQLTNGIWYPFAMLGQILWECDKPYDEIVEKVMKRTSTEMV